MREARIVGVEVVMGIEDARVRESKDVMKGVEDGIVRVDERERFVVVEGEEVEEEREIDAVRKVVP